LKLNSIDKLIESASGYLEAKFQLLKLELREEMAGFLVKSILIMTMLLLTTFMILFAGVGAALWLNDWLDSNYLGFLIIGGVLLLKIIFILLLKFTDSGNRIIRKFIGFLVED
jgi:Putative Actinobacterial Holin-X, holin superfamily III